MLTTLFILKMSFFLRKFQRNFNSEGKKNFVTNLKTKHETFLMNLETKQKKKMRTDEHF